MDEPALAWTAPSERTRITDRILARLRARPRWPWLVLAVGVLAVSTQLAVNSIPGHHVEGDFEIHREFGRRFLAGEPLYRNHNCFNYMPISALYYVPLAMMNVYVGPLVRAGVALACLMLTFGMLATMVRKRCDAARWDPLTLVAATAFLAFHYLLRDMLDGGPHLILLAMLVGGIYCAWRGRESLAGLWFGLAIALKMTPALFLPFMIWKRRWRLAAWTTVATLGWIALPAVFMGPANWWEHQNAWNQVALSVLLDSQDQLREGNEVRVQNQALKPALRRYLETYPPGHILRLNHPADRPILDLSPSLANRLANLGLLGLLAGFVVWSRRPLRGYDDPAWLLESSGVLILVLLLSPLVWLQHVVFMLPAIYLIVAQDGAIRKLPRPAAVVIWLYIVLSLVLNRELLGLRNYLVLLSYHSHTLCMLLILGLLMALRPTVARADRDPSALPALPARRLAA